MKDANKKLSLRRISSPIIILALVLLTYLANNYFADERDYVFFRLVNGTSLQLPGLQEAYKLQSGVMLRGYSDDMDEAVLGRLEKLEGERIVVGLQTNDERIVFEEYIQGAIEAKLVQTKLQSPSCVVYESQYLKTESPRYFISGGSGHKLLTMVWADEYADDKTLDVFCSGLLFIDEESHAVTS